MPVEVADGARQAVAPARKLRRSVDRLTRVLAVEILTAARAIDLRAGRGR